MKPTVKRTFSFLLPEYPEIKGLLYQNSACFIQWHPPNLQQVMGPVGTGVGYTSMGTQSAIPSGKPGS